MTSQLVQLLSALFGLIGGVILAFSLNRVLSELAFGINALSTSIEMIATKGDVFIFDGIDKRIKKANRISNTWVRAGIFCLGMSAVFAALGIYLIKN